MLQAGLAFLVGSASPPFFLAREPREAPDPSMSVIAAPGWLLCLNFRLAAMLLCADGRV